MPKYLLFKNQNVPVINTENFREVLFWNIEEESRLKIQEQNNSQLEVIGGEYYPLLWQMLPNNPD